MRHRQPKKSAQRSIWQIHWGIFWMKHWRAVYWRMVESYPEILFDTKLMNCLTPRPAQVIAKFREDYAENPKKATDHYYNFSVATNYIRKDRIAKDRRWKVPSEYGEIDITINLSKPEKDPKAIAAAKLAKQSAYPKCQL